MTTTPQPTMDERLAGQAGVPAVAPPPVRRLPGGRRRLPGPAVGQLVAAELVVFALLAAVGRQPWVLIVVGVLSLATVLLLFARRRNRWWYEHGLLRLSFRRANRPPSTAAPNLGAPPTQPGAMAPPGAPADQRGAALRELAPAFTVTEVTERAGTFGMAHDGTGWYAIVELLTAPPPGGAAGGAGGVAVPLRELAELVHGEGAVSRVQLVMHAAAAPVARLTAWSPAVASYRDVAARLAGPVPPSVSRTWLAVRLDAPDAILAAATRGGGMKGVRRSLSTALGRVGRVLSGAGLEYRMLDADGLLDALALSLGLAAQPGVPPAAAGTVGVTGAGGRTEKRWDRVVADGYAQVCFEVTGWPPHGGRLTAALAGLPAAWTTLSLVLGPRSDLTAPGEVPLRGQLRVAAAPDAIGPSCEALEEAAYTQAVRLRRMDGEHGPAAYATAPTGGGA
jgi:type VII secretion protein EccE